VFNHVSYYGAQDSDNAFYEGGRRYLISNLDALVLQDAFGYTINRPSGNQQLLHQPRPTTGNLLVRGGSAGENIYPAQRDPSHDTITIDSYSSGLHPG